VTPNVVVETASRLIRKRERGIELWASTAKITSRLPAPPE